MPTFTFILSIEEYGNYSIYLSYNIITSILIGMVLRVTIVYKNKNVNIEFKDDFDFYRLNSVFG